jgi:hypothetical protein
MKFCCADKTSSDASSNHPVFDMVKINVLCTQLHHTVIFAFGVCEFNLVIIHGVRYLICVKT